MIPRLLGPIFVCLVSFCILPSAALAEIGACLITKTDTNPFFAKMKEGANAKAAELGVLPVRE